MAEDDIAVGFMRAYWRGDLQAALGFCAPGACLELPPSVPLATPAPLSELLPTIFDGIYSRFVDGKFDVTIERVLNDPTVALGDSTAVLIEYVANGQLKAGGEFRCRYAMMLTLSDGKIVFARQYSDTLYLSKTLLTAK